MDADLIFEIASLVAMVGWLCLLATPFAPRFADLAAGLAIPAVLSAAYAGIIVVLLTGAPEGGEGPAVDFSTLDGVVALFSVREAVLVGWLHYLAFDLFVGAWEARTAKREGINFLLVVPCLVLTLFAGPAGFLLFLAVRSLAKPRQARPA